MGTRMAPIYANLFMAVVEDNILITASGGLNPEFCKRFIDDLLMVWLHGEASLLRFLDHADSLHPTKQFTMDGMASPSIFLMLYLPWKETAASHQTCTSNPQTVTRPSSVE